MKKALTIITLGMAILGTSVSFATLPYKASHNAAEEEVTSDATEETTKE